MNVLLMLLGVAIVYLAVKLIYRYNWNKGLSAKLDFDKKHVVKDDVVNLTEVVTNEKKLPLPCVNLKFQAARELRFPDTDTNSSVSDKTYRNDVFSFLANQRITRKVPVRCTKRGVFRISGLEITFAGLFMNEINVLKSGNECEITVYPKAADARELKPVNSRISGEAQRKKYMLEDPFVFRGIRDYTSNDSLKNVNWKASARTGNLMVNEYDESVSRNVCILLNLEESGALRYDAVDEEAISIASGIAEMLVSQGINVSIISNGCDVDTHNHVFVQGGAGMGHLNNINTALARIDTGIAMEEYSAMLEKILEPDNMRIESEYVYVLISASRRKKLQSVINKISRLQADMVWIVPHFPGDDYGLELCDFEPVGWEVK